MNWLILYHVTTPEEQRIFDQILQYIKNSFRYGILHLIYYYSSATEKSKVESKVHYYFTSNQRKSWTDNRQIKDIICTTSEKGRYNGFIYAGHSSGYLLGREESPLLSLLDLISCFHRRFEVAIFDTCYMNTLETLYQLQRLSRYLVATPSFYEDDSVLETQAFYLHDFTKDQDIQKYLKGIIDEFVIKKQKEDNTIRLSLIDNDHIDPIVKSVQNLHLIFNKESIVHPEDPQLHHLCDVLWNSYDAGTIGEEDFQTVIGQLKRLIVYTKSCWNCNLLGHHNVCVGIYSELPDHAMAKELEYFTF